MQELRQLHDRSTPEPNEQTADAFEHLKLIADETRWRLLTALRWSDYQVGELVERLALPQNLVSYHLGILRQAGLVQVHRSDADARANYYGLNIGALARLYAGLGTALALPGDHPAALPSRTVVFLCTANSARSQMAEGWLRHLSGGRITVRSAGTDPRPLHPLAVEVMAEAGIDIGYQQAKHVDDLADLQPDLVVTVCDIAREQCAVWQAAGARLHWSIPDPVAVRDPAAQAAAFRAVRDDLRRRVEGLPGLLSALLASTAI
jgi:ArsR family transcriptional regulator, arsenate/arsenite/antimonite-responsive transcriptional repressor / arsenate reductase (thioredoxin)